MSLPLSMRSLPVVNCVKVNDGQVAVCLAMCGEQGFVEADKIIGCDGDGGGYLEVVVVDVAGDHVEVGYFSAAQVPQVVFMLCP